MKPHTPASLAIQAGAPTRTCRTRLRRVDLDRYRHLYGSVSRPSEGYQRPSLHAIVIERVILEVSELRFSLVEPIV